MESDVHKAIQSILKAAVQSPSGDNRQPWRFEVQYNQIDVYETQSEVDVYGKLSLQITIGTLLESIDIAADHFGYKAIIDLYPDQKKARLIARVTLSPDSTDYQVDLFRFLPQRHTNRYSYKTNRLSSALVQKLCATAKPTEGRITFIDDPHTVKKLAEETSTQSWMIFSNPAVHSLFYSALTKEDAPYGIRAEQLGLSVFERFFILHVLKYWKLVSFLHFFGLRRLVHAFEAHRHAGASGYFIFTQPAHNLSDVTKVNAGRAFQRLWLTATKHGVAIQPAAAILLMHTAQQARKLLVTPLEKKVLEQCTSNIRALAGCQADETVLWIFRAGIADKKPEHKSKRMEPNIIFHN